MQVNSQRVDSCADPDRDQPDKNTNTARERKDYNTVNTQKSAHRRQPQLHRLVHFVSEINAFILFYFLAHHTYLFIHQFISLSVYQLDLSVYQLDLFFICLFIND